MDCSPPGPSVHGIFQARVLEWVAIAFSMQWYSLNLLNREVKVAEAESGLQQLPKVSASCLSAP